MIDGAVLVSTSMVENIDRKCSKISPNWPGRVHQSTDLRAWLFTMLHNQHVNDIGRSVREGANVSIEDAARSRPSGPTRWRCNTDRDGVEQRDGASRYAA